MRRITDAQLQKWQKCKEDTANCAECVGRWPRDVKAPLDARELPDPVSPIKILFVGVAPTPTNGRNKGTHFYSNKDDQLRVGLFKVLDKLDGTDFTNRNRSSAEAGTSTFLKAGFFFVHAAKVRPIGRPAPRSEIVCFCARRHLQAEIPVLAPEAVCFLGRKAGAAAKKVLGSGVSEEPIQVMIQGWNGAVAIALQPVRGTRAGKNSDRTATTIKKLRGANHESPTG